MSSRIRLRRAAVVVMAAVLVSGVAACSKKSGPDLAKDLNTLPTLTKLSVPPPGLDASGADGIWESDGSTIEVADLIAAKARPDERSTSGRDQLMLYRSGTVWVSELNGKSEVVLYKDNDKAYRRHSALLLANSAWGRRMDDYREGGGSNNGFFGSGNGFRSGGSGSGK